MRQSVSHLKQVGWMRTRSRARELFLMGLLHWLWSRGHVAAFPELSAGPAQECEGFPSTEGRDLKPWRARPRAASLRVLLVIASDPGAPRTAGSARGRSAGTLRARTRDDLGPRKRRAARHCVAADRCPRWDRELGAQTEWPGAPGGPACLSRSRAAALAAACGRWEPTDHRDDGSSRLPREAAGCPWRRARTS